MNSCINLLDTHWVWDPRIPKCLLLTTVVRILEGNTQHNTEMSRKLMQWQFCSKGVCKWKQQRIVKHLGNTKRNHFQPFPGDSSSSARPPGTWSYQILNSALTMGSRQQRIYGTNICISLFPWSSVSSQGLTLAKANEKSQDTVAQLILLTSSQPQRGWAGWSKMSRETWRANRECVSCGTSPLPKQR